MIKERFAILGLRAVGMCADRVFFFAAWGIVRAALAEPAGVDTHRAAHCFDARLWPPLTQTTHDAPLSLVADLAGGLLLAVPGVAAMLLLCAYVVVSIALWGATPGMTTAGVRLVRSGGGRPGAGRALWRHVLSYVSAGLLMVGYLWAIFDKDGRTLHDIWSGTVVVRK